MYRPAAVRLHGVHRPFHRVSMFIQFLTIHLDKEQIMARHGKDPVNRLRKLRYFFNLRGVILAKAVEIAGLLPVGAMSLS